MADRGEVKLREGKINGLIDLYHQAYKDLSRELITATEAGKIQKVRTMARIRVILGELGDNVGEWVSKEIPQYYQDGANHALQDMRKLGIAVDSGATVIDREAIAALVDEVNLAFAEGITTVGRSAERTLSNALKQQLQFTIADGKLTGEALRTITASVKAELQERGLAALVDRGGREWTLDRYAEMLVRTKAVEARNQGMAYRMLQSGYDLVQVSNHGSDHPSCAFWEGKILSLTGRTPGYPTVAQATEAGLFHPNCQHAINVINLDLASRTQAYENPYLQTGDTPPKPIKQDKVVGKGFSIAKNNVLNVTNGKDTFQTTLTPAEVELIQKRGIAITTTPTAKARRATLGHYDRNNNELYLKNLTGSTVESTFFHELGHVLDPALHRESRGPGFYQALSADSKQVVIERMVRTGVKRDDAAIFYSNGVVDNRKFPRSYISYLRSESEVFADAYSQFRTNPDRFKEYAPELFKYFSGGTK